MKSLKLDIALKQAKLAEMGINFDDLYGVFQYKY